MLTCHKCGHLLDFAGEICPCCGSRLVRLDESIKVLDGIELKKKNRNIFTSKKRKNIYEEFSDNWEVFRKTGELQHTVRIVDRLNDQYYEHIEFPDRKAILHKEEPLHEHYGHGSAKKRTKK